MTLSSQVSRPTPQDWRIITLLSTERGRRSALFSSVQCLLSVIGSMGIILLFAGIPQLIYSPEVTVTNVVTFLSGGLLLSLMVAGNACIGYRFRAQIEELRGVLREREEGVSPPDDKPPSYDELTFCECLPPDYYSLVNIEKERNNDSESAHLVEIVPTHSGPRLSRSSSRDSNASRTEANSSRRPSHTLSKSASASSLNSHLLVSSDECKSSRRSLNSNSRRFETPSSTVSSNPDPTKQFPTRRNNSRPVNSRPEVSEVTIVRSNGISSCEAIVESPPHVEDSGSLPEERSRLM